MAKKLDRKRGFGEVAGHSGGACFEQDGVLFDAAGDELVTADQVAAAEASKKAATADKAKAAAKEPAKVPAKEPAKKAATTSEPVVPAVVVPENSQLSDQLNAGGASDFAA